MLIVDFSKVGHFFLLDKQFEMNFAQFCGIWKSPKLLRKSIAFDLTHPFRPAITVVCYGHKRNVLFSSAAVVLGNGHL